MTPDFPQKPLASQVHEPTMVVVESESFVVFDQWMDEQLDGLVARWVHAAAPNAARAELLSRRGVE